MNQTKVLPCCTGCWTYWFGDHQPVTMTLPYTGKCLFCVDRTDAGQFVHVNIRLGLVWSDGRPIILLQVEVTPADTWGVYETLKQKVSAGEA